MTVIYKNERQYKRAVYFAGTTTLKEGWLLCYNRDIKTGGSADGAWQVEKPKTANLDDFAGVVASESDQQVTPGWITINEPAPSLGAGRLVKVRSNVACTAATTLLGIVGATFDAAAGSSARPVIAMAQQTGGTTTGAAVLCALTEAWEADKVTQTQTALTAASGQTTGGTALLQSITIVYAGATTGATWTLDDSSGSSTINPTKVNNNFTRLADQINFMRNDDNKGVDQLGAITVDVKAIIGAMKKAGLMVI